MLKRLNIDLFKQLAYRNDETSISTVPRGCAWQVFEASLATCCEFATGLHIVGSGIYDLIC